MVEYDKNADALTLGDDDSIAVGDYELKYSSTDDEWQAEYGRPIGGEGGFHGDIAGATYDDNEVKIGEHSISFENEYIIGALNESVDFVTESYPVNGLSFWFYVEDNISGEYKKRNRGPLIGFQGTGSVIWIGSFISQFEDETISIFDGSESFSTKVSISSGWHHLAISWNSAESRYNLYFDNTLQTELFFSSNDNPDKFTGLTHFAHRTGFEQYWSGKLDDVRLYDKVLTSSEIDTLFNKGDVTDGLVSRYNFEFPETAKIAIDSTGDAFPQNSVPRSTSGSLVPEGFADVLSNGEVLADNGEIYASVQDAVNAASGFVFVGPGTFNENVTISTEGLMLEGSGHDTLIDGGTISDAIIVQASNVTIKNLSTQTTPGNNEFTDGVNITGTHDGFCTVENVTVRDTEQSGFNIQAGTDNKIINCVVVASNNNGIFIGDNIDRTIVIRSSFLNGISNDAIRNDNADDVIISNNHIEGASGDGIVQLSAAHDGIISGNRVHNIAGDGIRIFGDDSIFANNRVSDTGNQNIDDNGSGNLLDNNLTGPSN